LCDALTQACQPNASPAPQPPEPSPPPARTESPRPPPVAETVRVRLALLDELIKTTGELMSSHARLRHRLTELHAMDLSMNTSTAPVTVAQPLHQFFRQLREDVAAQAVLMDELHDRTLQMRMLPLSIVFEPAARQVRELARSVGKQVECRIQGAGIELDRQMIDKLADPIVHLVRNAIDHGLELPEARLAAGKSAQGQLVLSARQDGRWVVIEIADDGRGIVLEEVRAQAARKGLIGADKTAILNERETIDLLFLPGFSTRGQISELSGRGVGLDVVRQTVLDELQGTIGVETRPGAGTTFTLRMPLSLAMMRVVLVEADGLPFAIGAGYIVELIRLPEAACETVADGHAVAIRNELMAVTTLAELLRIPERRKRPATRTDAGRGMLLMVLRARERKMALRIDRLLDECNMVIHPVPVAISQFPLVSGLVIDGENRLIGLLHPPALFDQARRGERHREARFDPPEARERILVVDDSLNTREIEKEVLEAHGYRVALAEDGEEGLRMALAGRYAAVLTDVEMPGMDGFTLTARLRREENYRTTPIVILSSRGKEEDKRRGMQAGADAYLVKGDFNQDNLVQTLRNLLG
ncbi:MAG: response regulator, partial [Magnetococcales bacterium]|nr:response regulator [Magnetococcales bacterium]